MGTDRSGVLTFRYMTTGLEGAVERPWWRLVPAFLIAAIGLHAASPSELAAAELKPKTLQAFNQYVALAEARMKRHESHPNDFLYIESLPKSEYDSIIKTLRRGDIFV